DVDVDGVVFKQPATTDTDAALVVFAGDDDRRVEGELADSLEDVLRRVGGKVGGQLVVDRQVRGQNEEVSNALRPVQIGDEGAHEAGFADAGGQRETERREFALEVLDCLELVAENPQGSCRVGSLLQLD